MVLKKTGKPGEFYDDATKRSVPGGEAYLRQLTA